MNSTSSIEKSKIKWKCFIVSYEIFSVGLFAQMCPNVGYFREDPLKTKYQVKDRDAKEETDIASRTT